MHFIHLNVNSHLSKIDEICYIDKLKNVTVIGLSKTVLRSELWNRRIWPGKVWPILKNSISYNQKSNFALIQRVFL